jgi:hypothetical protein
LVELRWPFAKGNGPILPKNAGDTRHFVIRASSFFRHSSFDLRHSLSGWPFLRLFDNVPGIWTRPGIVAAVQLTFSCRS